MKAYAGSKVTLLVAALLQLVSFCYGRRVDNFVLARCPNGENDAYCHENDKAVVYPAGENKAPGYLDPFYNFIVQWEVPHLLTWEKTDDEPLNLTIALGGYSMHKEIRDERSLNFTFEDLARQLMPKSNESTVERNILGKAMETAAWNGIYFTYKDPPSANFSYIAGIQYFYTLPSSLYQFVEGTAEKQKSIGKSDQNKVWSIGVGVGVGVGVPLLMGATYFLGQKRWKRRHLATK